MWILIICLLVLGGSIYVIVQQNSYKEQVKVDDKKHLAFINKNGITQSYQYIFNDTIYCHYYWIIADETKKTVYLATEKQGSYFIPISYDEIVSAEIIVNNEVKGQVSRAVVGGIIAGGVGSIVGALTAKEFIMSYSLLIKTINQNHPLIEWNFINQKTKPDSYNFKQVAEFSNNVCSLLKRISNGIQVKQLTHSDSFAKADNNEISVRLKKLQNTYESGFISQTEYEQKRKEIIDTI